MKFQQLALGARFEFEGTDYVKSGPLTATSAAGLQRMIPRFAVLKPLDSAQSVAPVKAVGRIEAERVLTAFEAFYQDAASLLQADDAQPSSQKLATLFAARQRFLNGLE
jgi:hypothetical protein